MARVGDRVVMEGTKIGSARREGTLVGMNGPLLRVRWGDGQETILTPAPGSIQFLPAARRAAVSSTAKAPARTNAKRATTTRDAKGAPSKGRGTKRR